MKRYSPVVCGILLFLSLLTVLAGCRTAQPAVQEPPASRVPAHLPPPVAELYRRGATVTSIAGRLKLAIAINGRRHSGIAVFSQRRDPLHVRVDIYSIMGLKVFALEVKRDEFLLLDYLSRRYISEYLKDLPPQYAGWHDLWQLYPIPQPAVLAEADWQQQGDTWVGNWASSGDHEYRMEIAAGDPCLSRIGFVYQGEELGVLELTTPGGDPALPRNFNLTGEGLVVTGELQNVEINEATDPAPLSIPDSFRKIE